MLTARIFQIRSLGFGHQPLPLEFEEDLFHLERMDSSYNVQYLRITNFAIRHILRYPLLEPYNEVLVHSVSCKRNCTNKH